jgi:hypothetical protein
MNLPPLTQRRRGVKTTRHTATAGVSQGKFSGLCSGGAVAKIVFEMPILYLSTHRIKRFLMS